MAVAKSTIITVLFGLRGELWVAGVVVMANGVLWNNVVVIVLRVLYRFRLVSSGSGGWW